MSRGRFLNGIRSMRDETIQYVPDGFDVGLDAFYNETDTTASLSGRRPSPGQVLVYVCEPLNERYPPRVEFTSTRLIWERGEFKIGLLPSPIDGDTCPDFTKSTGHT